MKKILPALTLIILLLAVSACGTPTRDPNQPVIDRDAAESYSAEFNLQLTGAKNWTYLLKTRKSPDLREINLHIGGIEGAQNPGDIRLVTDKVTTWVIGPGTDQQCVQFPNGKGMYPTFLYPESLVSLAELNSLLKPLDEEQLDGLAVLHFRTTGAAVGSWKGATIDLWQEKSTGMLRQFKMTAAGEDPFFGTGPGNLTATYNTGALGSETIAPVAGCEIGVKLPEAISMFVRLPGLASFESKSSIDELTKFFQTTLPGQNWVEKAPPAQVNGETVLSYQRGAEGVDIQMKPNPAGGSAVKLVFLQGQ